MNRQDRLSWQFLSLSNTKPNCVARFSLQDHSPLPCMSRIMCDGSFCAFALRLKSAAVTPSQNTLNASCALKGSRVLCDANQCLKICCAGYCEIPITMLPFCTEEELSKPWKIYPSSICSGWKCKKLKPEKNLLRTLSHSRISEGMLSRFRWYQLWTDAMHPNFCGWHNFSTPTSG